MNRVWMIGGSGLVGRGVAKRLRARTDVALELFGRRDSGAPDETVIDFDELPAGLPTTGCNIAISCLGSTIKKAGSWDEFARVDTGYVTGFAAAAGLAGARHFIHVGSVGADVGSLNRYLAMKGQTEEWLRALGFERLDIVQPGLLLGDRGEFRLGERIGTIATPALSPLLVGGARKYRGVNADAVSRAITTLVGFGEAGTFWHRNPEIEALDPS
ncbi:MAG: NAD(P)H-binding protein [Pacificimonas sp.]